MEKKIEVIQLCESIRGHTYDNSFVIIEEVQNTTPQQLELLLKRIGKNTKIVLTGDLKQSGLSEKNGLVDFMEKYSSYKKNKNLTEDDLGIKIVELTYEDVQRSELCKKIVDIYENYDTLPEPKLDVSTSKLIKTLDKTNTSTITYNKSVLKSKSNKSIIIYENENNDCALIPKDHYKHI